MQFTCVFTNTSHTNIAYSKATEHFEQAAFQKKYIGSSCSKAVNS